MKPDASNPSFGFSEIFLYVPWRTLDELPQSDEECVSKFLEEQQLHLDSELLEESNAKIARQEKLDLLKNSHDSSFLTSLPSSEYVFVTDPVNAKHNYTPEVIEKASNFLKVCLKPWLDEKKDFVRLSRTSCANETNCSQYRYPILNDDGASDENELMADSLWIPFALAMQQSRRRFKSSLEHSRCKPLQFIINGEGGSGKS
ncbi:hypothetical protein JG687_00014763 [Phytophthora cactorum]|uniref:Uncharacterized protein n=1 Tax=Phytophthora cactorum TaxID=29920 RepID=A0A8T1TXT4_9STRA|nr:hypothetical protein JG687_00014763 [Phytophthora cactorum]